MTNLVADPQRWLSQYRARATRDLLEHVINAIKAEMVTPRRLAYSELNEQLQRHKSSSGSSRTSEARLRFQATRRERARLQRELTFLVRALRLAQLHRQDFFTRSRRSPIDLGVHVLGHALRRPGVLLLTGTPWMSSSQLRALHFTQNNYTEDKALLAQELIDRFNVLFPALDQATSVPKNPEAALQDTLYRKVVGSTQLTAAERALLDTLFSRN